MVAHVSCGSDRLDLPVLPGDTIQSAQMIAQRGDDRRRLVIVKCHLISP